MQMISLKCLTRSFLTTRMHSYCWSMSLRGCFQLIADIARLIHSSQAAQGIENAAPQTMQSTPTPIQTPQRNGAVTGEGQQLSELNRKLNAMVRLIPCHASAHLTWCMTFRTLYLRGSSINTPDKQCCWKCGYGLILKTVEVLVDSCKFAFRVRVR